MLERFEALGLSSVWHEHRGEAHGAESQATHFHRWSPQSPYHIDYVFASQALAARVRSVTLGSHPAWVAARISDHVPLCVEFEEG